MIREHRIGFAHTPRSSCFNPLPNCYVDSCAITRLYIWLPSHPYEVWCMYRSSAWSKGGVPTVAYVGAFWRFKDAILNHFALIWQGRRRIWKDGRVRTSASRALAVSMTYSNTLWWEEASTTYIPVGSSEDNIRINELAIMQLRSKWYQQFSIMLKSDNYCFVEL